MGQTLHQALLLLHSLVNQPTSSEGDNDDNEYADDNDDGDDNDDSDDDDDLDDTRSPTEPPKNLLLQKVTLVTITLNMTFFIMVRV